ncbi:MAG: hypothetical protein KF859_00105 [Phycisphaeraceae bacterium]|nr:hypothetical protein [Phycisphaeraceae bacterium]
MKNAKAFGIVALAGSALATVASAQLTSFQLDDGLFRYAERSITGSAVRTGTGGGSADFGKASGATAVVDDYLFQNWWWYRGSNDTREFALSNQVSGVQLSPNSVALVYEEPVGGGTAPALRVSLVYTLNQISTTQAAVTINWNITNISMSTENVSFFAYTDWDVLGAGGDLYSRLLSFGYDQIRADDTTGGLPNGAFATNSADLRLPNAWQVGPFSGTGSPRTALTNTTVDSLNNAINGTNPSDLAGAHQWDLTLRPGESAGGRYTKGYNYDPIPTPGTVALLGLGGLAALRRRR